MQTQSDQPQKPTRKPLLGGETPPAASEQPCVTEAPADALPDDLISVKKAAHIAKCHIAAIYRWVAKGTLAGWKRANGRLFVSRAAVVGLFTKVVPTSDADPQLSLAKLERRRRVDAILREARVG